MIVYDAESGQYKRHWGAYGHEPDDTDLGPYDPDAPVPQQFRPVVHCVEMSADGAWSRSSAISAAAVS